MHLTSVSFPFEFEFSYHGNILLYASNIPFVHAGITDMPFVHAGITDMPFVHVGIIDIPFVHAGIIDITFVHAGLYIYILPPIIKCWKNICLFGIHHNSDYFLKFSQFYKGMFIFCYDYY